MSSLKKIFGLKDYQTFAGPDWPSYQDLLDGDTGSSIEIQQEVNEFLSKVTQTYQELTLTGDQLAQNNQHRQSQIFFDKQIKNIQHCSAPWQTLGINSNGDIFICSSPSWIPKFVGNILTVDSVFDALNSRTAQQIRQEILANRYFYCNNKICGFFGKISPDTYQTQPTHTDPLDFESAAELLVDKIPQNLIFDFDSTCNFQCPSCRTQLINNNKHHVIRPINDRIVQQIKRLVIDKIDQAPTEIRWCGGEPFISDVYLDLMEYISQANKPNIQHVIQTNGSYLQKKSHLVESLLPSLKELRISFDAATAETYQKIRVNGQWDQLLDNVQWVRNTIRANQYTTKLSVDFVVQLDNYKEIPALVELCNQLEIDHINFQKMWNWGTWSREEFDNKNIYTPTHPLYQDLISTFKIAKQEIKF